MGNDSINLSLEEQLIELQNRMLQQKQDEVKIKEKLDELTERADFYENLHNKEQEKLYEAECLCTDLKEQLLETEKKSIDNTGSKQLVKTLLKRIRRKVIGR